MSKADSGEYLYSIATQEALKGNWNAARQNLHLAILNGNVRAMYALGICYRDGNGGRKNFRLARHWLRKAAVRGDSDAMLRFAVMCELGRGGPKDLNEALRFYRRSHKRGNRDATVELARIYFWGVGVERNLRNARKLYQTASEDNDEAAYRFAQMLAQGVGGKANRDAAIAIFDRLKNTNSAYSKWAAEYR